MEFTSSKACLLIAMSLRARGALDAACTVGRACYCDQESTVWHCSRGSHDSSAAASMLLCRLAPPLPDTRGVPQLNNAAYAMMAANASIQKAAEQQAAMMHLTQANPGAPADVAAHCSKAALCCQLHT